MKKTFHITTFGCQMNEHDSEVMAGMLLEKGFEAVKERKDADVLIINTCSINQLHRPQLRNLNPFFHRISSSSRQRRNNCKILPQKEIYKGTFSRISPPKNSNMLNIHIPDNFKIQHSANRKINLTRQQQCCTKSYTAPLQKPFCIFTKVVKTGRRTISLLDCYAEVHPILEIYLKCKNFFFQN